MIETRPEMAENMAEQAVMELLPYTGPGVIFQTLG